MHVIDNFKGTSTCVLFQNPSTCQINAPRPKGKSVGENIGRKRGWQGDEHLKSLQFKGRTT